MMIFSDSAINWMHWWCPNSFCWSLLHSAHLGCSRIKGEKNKIKEAYKDSQNAGDVPGVGEWEQDVCELMFPPSKLCLEPSCLHLRRLTESRDGITGVGQTLTWVREDIPPAFGNVGTNNCVCFSRWGHVCYVSFVLCLSVDCVLHLDPVQSVNKDNICFNYFYGTHFFYRHQLVLTPNQSYWERGRAARLSNVQSPAWRRG